MHGKKLRREKPCLGSAKASENNYNLKQLLYSKNDTLYDQPVNTKSTGYAYTCIIYSVHNQLFKF